MNQLSLPISLDSKMLLENLVGNRQILNFIDQLYSLGRSAEIYVYGSSGGGKTHLLQGGVFRALAEKQSGVYIDCYETLPEHLFESIEQLRWISIDNIDAISPQQQHHLFEIYNRAKQAQVSMLISGSGVPAQLNLINDLKTRLSLATVFPLEELDDELTQVILNNQMSERNLSVDLKVYEYLFKHYSRDVNRLLFALDRLDEASLQAKQGITIPFVKKTLSL